MFNAFRRKKIDVDVHKEARHPVSDLLAPFIQAKKVDYAYMLNGDWGSGKTHYLNEVLERDFPVLKSNVYYASANGIKYFSEITDQLLQVKLGQKSGIPKELTNIGASLMKLFPKGQAISGIFKNSARMLLKNLVTKNDIIIIDDLERISDTYDRHSI